MWTGTLLCKQSKGDRVKGLSLLLNVEAHGVASPLGKGGAQPSVSFVCGCGPGRLEPRGPPTGRLGTPEVPGALRILGVPGLNNQHKFKRLPAWGKKKERKSRAIYIATSISSTYLKIKENSINVENCSYQSPEMRLQLFAPPPGREGIRGEDVSTLATSVDMAVRVDTCCGRTVSSVSPRQVGDGPCSFRELCPARDCVHTHTHTHTRTRSLTHTHTHTHSV